MCKHPSRRRDMVHRHARGRLALLAAGTLAASMALAPGAALAQGGPATADAVVLGTFDTELSSS
jgi:hypothetical protein